MLITLDVNLAMMQYKIEQMIIVNLYFCRLKLGESWPCDANSKSFLTKPVYIGNGVALKFTFHVICDRMSSKKYCEKKLSSRFM